MHYCCFIYSNDGSFYSNNDIIMSSYSIILFICRVFDPVFWPDDDFFAILLWFKGSLYLWISSNLRFLELVVFSLNSYWDFYESFWIFFVDVSLFIRKSNYLFLSAIFSYCLSTSRLISWMYKVSISSFSFLRFILNLLS